MSAEHGVRRTKAHTSAAPAANPLMSLKRIGPHYVFYIQIAPL